MNVAECQILYISIRSLIPPAFGGVLCWEDSPESLPGTALSARSLPRPRLRPLAGAAYVQLLNSEGCRALVPLPQCRMALKTILDSELPVGLAENFFRDQLFPLLNTSFTSWRYWWMHVAVNLTHAISTSEAAPQGTWPVAPSLPLHSFRPWNQLLASVNIKLSLGFNVIPRWNCYERCVSAIQNPLCFSSVNCILIVFLQGYILFFVSLCVLCMVTLTHPQFKGLTWDVYLTIQLSLF